jgi:hypothetical protein
MMAKARWNDLINRCPGAPLLIAVLPDSSEKERLFNAQSAQRLLVRLIRKLEPQGEFAVTVSRQSSQREILCAFGDSSDAAVVAKIAKAALAPSPGRVRYSFVLDERAEQSLTKIAGAPQPQRQPRMTPYERWQA